jgi:hypothetical protein
MAFGSFFCLFYCFIWLWPPLLLRLSTFSGNQNGHLKRFKYGSQREVITLEK